MTDTVIKNTSQIQKLNGISCGRNKFHKMAKTKDKLASIKPYKPEPSEMKPRKKKKSRWTEKKSETQEPQQEDV